MQIDGKEKELVRQAQEGDKEAFLRLIQPYQVRVYATAMRLLGNADDAREVTQETILRTFWKIQTFRGRAHFYTWLYRTALNLCYKRMSDTHAKIKARSFSLNEPREDEEGGLHEVELPDPHQAPDREAQTEEEVQLVRKALASLDPIDFQVLVLREVEELSYDQIAQRLKIPKGTVMSRLHRGRLALANRLKAMGIS